MHPLGDWWLVDGVSGSSELFVGEHGLCLSLLLSLFRHNISRRDSLSDSSRYVADWQKRQRNEFSPEPEHVYSICFYHLHYSQVRETESES